MKDYRDLEVHLRRQQQLIREVEHERLVRDALKAQPRKRRNFSGIFRFAIIGRLFQAGKPAEQKPVTRVKPLPSSR